MRALILSDIHANLTALEAVLDAAPAVDQVWCLGDVVGYGPDPNECVRRLRGIKDLVCIMGNHDAAVTGKIRLETFNPEARASIQWTRAALSNDNLEWLGERPESLALEGATLAHGSPRNPIWEYILDPATAALCFDSFATQICFIGHTHLPIIYSQNHPKKPAAWTVPVAGEKITPLVKSIINPGSVGQPRDRDSRAALGIFDTEAQSYLPLRVAYNFRAVQERIRAHHLPARLAARLSEGW